MAAVVPVDYHPPPSRSPLMEERIILNQEKGIFLSFSLFFSSIFSGATTSITSSSTIIVAVVGKKKLASLFRNFYLRNIYIYIFFFLSLITAVTPPLVLQLYRVRLYYYNYAKIFFDPFPLPLPSLNFDPRKKKLLYRDRDAVILRQLKFPFFLSRRAGKSIHIYIWVR